MGIYLSQSACNCLSLIYKLFCLGGGISRRRFSAYPLVCGRPGFLLVMVPGRLLCFKGRYNSAFPVRASSMSAFRMAPLISISRPKLISDKSYRVFNSGENLRITRVNRVSSIFSMMITSSPLRLIVQLAVLKHSSHLLLGLN